MYRLDTEHNTFGNRQLFEYAIEGKSKKLQKILERDGNIPVDITNNKGQSMLYVSCLYQRFKVVALLLQFGADPNHRSVDGSTPTHAAAYSCSPEILKCIVEDYGGDMRLHDKQMRTPREWAIRAGRTLNRKVLRLIDTWQDQVDKKMYANVKPSKGVMKVARSEEMLKSNLKIDYCGYGSFLRSSRSSGYFGFAAVVPLASPTHITTPGNLSLSFPTPPSFVMEEALWCHYRVMIKRSKGKSFSVSRASEDLLISEAKACRVLRHPNLLLLMAICVTSPEETCSGTTDHWLVYEYVRFGSLYHVLHDTKRNFLPSESAKILLQIADALSFIHQRGFIHCTVSSHTIYLSEGFVAKLGGMCCVISSGGTHIEDLAAILPHFTRWVAPEVILKEPITTKTDVYGFCVVVCETFSGSLPWYGCDNKNIEQHIKSRRNYFRLPEWLPSELLEMLQNGLKFYSRNRIINTSDLQGCITTLLESGKLDRLVTGLSGVAGPTEIIEKPVYFSPKQINVDTGKIMDSNATSVYVTSDYKPTALYPHVMSVGGFYHIKENAFDLSRGQDVPDARPISFMESNKEEVTKFTDVRIPINKQISCHNDDCQNNEATVSSKPKSIEVTADVHINGQSIEESGDKLTTGELEDFAGSKGTFGRRLSSTHPKVGISPLQSMRRPHSCSILTQDGFVRELLPNVRHHSVPNISSEPTSYSSMPPPSYNLAISSQNKLSKMIPSKQTASNLERPAISITGPPDTVYSPPARCLNSLPPLLSKNAASSSISSKVDSENTKKKAKNSDLSSSFATTSDHLSIPFSTTSYIYPSSSERQAELSKEYDTPSTSNQNSHKDAKGSNFSESTDIPDSSFVVENAPPPDYIQFKGSIPNYNDSQDLTSVKTNARTIQHSQSLSGTKSDRTSNAKEDMVSSMTFRTASYGRGKRLIANNRRKRWSTSALVERSRINNGEFSSEEMYNIDHDDLEFIFESFAERKNQNVSFESPPNSAAQLNDRVEQTSYFDKASQTESEFPVDIPHIERDDDEVDVLTKRHDVKGKGDDPTPLKTKCYTTFTNTENSNRPASVDSVTDSQFAEQDNLLRKPVVIDETSTGHSQQKPIMIITHHSMLSKSPHGDQAAIYHQTCAENSSVGNTVMSFKGCMAPNQSSDCPKPSVAFNSISSEESGVSSSNEYLYSQEFAIPVDLEECTSIYDQQFEDLTNDNIATHDLGTRCDSFASQTDLQIDLSSMKISQGTDTSSTSWQYGGDNISEEKPTIQQLTNESQQDENTQFMTCLESEDRTADQGVAVVSETVVEEAPCLRNIALEVKNQDFSLGGGKCGETDVSSGRIKIGESALFTDTPAIEKDSGKHQEAAVNAVAQTPSKWPFHKKLCLFKVVADNGNGSNLEKIARKQSAFSKVRQTAEMFENLTPPPSPRGHVPEKVISPPPSTDDTGSTLDSSKFLQDHMGQNFDTSTPVSVNAPLPVHDSKVQYRHAVTPRTFEDVRRDIETSRSQKCHFVDKSHRCDHESEAMAINESHPEEKNSSASEFVGEQMNIPKEHDASTTFYTNQSNSYEELKINPSPICEVRQMVHSMLNDMIQNAIMTLDGRLEGMTTTTTQETDSSKLENNQNEIKSSRSEPAVSLVDDPYPPSVRLTQSVTDLNSLTFDVTNDRFAQECSSFSSDVVEHQHGSNYYRSVDTSIWSL